MAGLLGSMLAGATKSVAQGRIKDIERQEQFDMQKALMDAQIDKQLRLKEAGYAMDDARAAKQAETRAGYLEGAETIDDAAGAAFKAGDFATAKDIISFKPKEGETKTLKPGEVMVDSRGQVLFTAPESGGYKYERVGGSLFVIDEKTGKKVDEFKGAANVSIVKHEGTGGGAAKTPAAQVAAEARIKRLVSAGMSEKTATMIVDGGSMKPSDAARLYSNMSSFERKRAFGENHTRQGAINQLLSESQVMEDGGAGAKDSPDGAFTLDKYFD